MNFIELAQRSGTLTIASAATESDAFDARGYGRFLLLMPAAFTGATISFKVSHDNVTYKRLRGSDNQIVQVTVVADEAYSLPAALGSCRYFKIVSASAEGAARSLVVVAQSAAAGETGGGSGSSPGTGATDLGKAEDAPHASGDVGVELLTKRTDAAASSAGTDGDYATLNSDALGRLWAHVEVVDRVVPGVLAGDLGKAEDTPHTTGDVGVMILGRQRSIAAGPAASAGSDNDYATFNLDDTGRLWANAGQNTEVTVLASAARTATPTKVDQTNLVAVGLILVIDVTAVTATPSVTFTIQGKDPLSSKYYTILASVAISGTGTTVLRVHPDLTAAANTIAKDMLPRTWAVDAVHGDADSITYSVSGLLVGV